MTTKKYVRIHSKRTIQVTSGLQHEDVTNPDAHVPDRLKISPRWPLCLVVINQGSHLYPSEIVDWPTVKALAKDKVLTIGEFTDDLDEEDSKTAETKIKLEENLKKLNQVTKTKKLSDIAQGE